MSYQYPEHFKYPEGERYFFLNHVDAWEHFLPNYGDEPRVCLEIGALYGGSSVYILDEFHKMKIEGKQLTPIVELDAANKKHFYAPIIMKPNCLVCHGTINETVNIKTDSIIKSLYPNDKAIGYAEGDLRGIWSITFKN